MAKAKRKAGKTPNAIDLLKQDHAAVKKAFKQFEKSKYKDPNARREFVATICNDLIMHTELEEQIFYPAVRQKLKNDDLMNEALVEHNSAKQLIAELQKMQGDDPMLKATASVLSEYVNHHVREEEREILPKAQRLKLDLAGLADEMRARKDELKALAFGKEVPWQAAPSIPTTCRPGADARRSKAPI
jgi:hemerythrin-like domain-containing protein